MRSLFLTVILNACLINLGLAQFFVKKMSIRRTPAISAYSLKGEDYALTTGYFPGRQNWIVFSDRNENFTYTKAESGIVFKSLAFMDACYVVGQKGEFVELIKYDPKLLESPGKHKVDAKNAEYLGWIKRENLLLWHGSIKDSSSLLPIKAVTAFKNENAIQFNADNVTNDSLLSFSSPIASTQYMKVALRDLLFVYKESADGKRWLVGKAAQFTADSCRKNIIGWMDADYLKLWGTRLCLVSSASSNNDQRFYIDTLNDASFFSTAVNVEHQKRIDGMYGIEKSVRHDSITNYLKTYVLADVFDYSNNFAINVLGNKINYDESQKNSRAQGNLNIVFVVDGGKNNSKYVSSLLNTFQSLSANLRNNDGFKNVKYGAVVYKGNLVECEKNNVFRLHEGIEELAEFFQRQLGDADKCNNDTIAQAMFTGLQKGAALLSDHRGESNIIVVIGAAGNNMGRDASWSDVVNAINRVNARMLIFQTHNISHPSFNDFVIEAKDLVLNTAANNAELKKEKLIDSKQVLAESDFSLLGGDSGVYYLEYPERSMEPGYVIFPAKNRIMPPYLLEKNLESLVADIQRDNYAISSSYKKYFGTFGFNNTKILSRYKNYFPLYADRYLPGKLIQFVHPGSPVFCIPAWISYSINGDQLNGLQKGLLLAEDEYAQMQSVFEKLGKLYDEAHQGRRYIYRHFYKELKAASNRLGFKKIAGYKSYSFATAVDMMTGYKTNDSLLQTKQLYTIKKKGQLTDEEILAILKIFKDKSAWMKAHAADKEYVFTSNGQKYYMLAGAKLF